MLKPDILKARLPRGFADRGAADLAATHRMMEAIRRTYELYGFEGLETPFIESTEALGKFLPDQDRPNEGVFSFQDDDESWLSLRYDLTAPLARHVAERLDAQALTLPLRSYRSGWVFRNEKPGPGRFRQFMQFDADIVGSASPAADAEIAMLMADTLEAVGLTGKYVIKISNRKVLEGLMEAIGLGGVEQSERRLTVLRAIDKVDRFGFDETAKLLGGGRRDESGDFMKGAGLADQAITRVLNFTGWGEEGSGAGSTVRSNVITLNNFQDEVEGSEIGRQGLQELREVDALIGPQSWDAPRIVIDPSVVRGLEYYTGAVFEADLTTSDDAGPRFGSVAGGGRYDGLVGRFRSEPVPATGFSIGVSRLLAALQHVGSPIVADAAAAGPVVVLVMDRDRPGDYQRMVSRLRSGDDGKFKPTPAEMYLGPAGMKAQMKYADRRRAPCVVIQGSQEKERGEVQVKDLVAGAVGSGQGAPATNAEYRAARLAQVTVPEGEMVAAVRAVIARQESPPG